jgi:endogenous inhibitor of DNA gyrase (YacG/DUF329 family)
MVKYTKEYNRALCKRYPFLIPTNAWTGKRITEGAGFFPDDPDEVPEWDYEHTELDAMPSGWRKAFGEQLCEELKEELIKANGLESYQIIQIKEKFGMLCWYDNGNTQHGREILDKYEEMSARKCIECGAPATWITTGWVCPYCDDCCPNTRGSIPIDEWFARVRRIQAKQAPVSDVGEPT